MINSLTKSRDYVFKLNCGKCGVESFIGFRANQEQQEDALHGILGVLKVQDREIGVGVWVHCPACDNSIQDEKEWLSSAVEITKPVIPGDS